MPAFFQNSQHYIWVSFQVANRNEFEISDGIVLGCKSQQRGLYLRHESVTRHVSEESRRASVAEYRCAHQGVKLSQSLSLLDFLL